MKAITRWQYEKLESNAGLLEEHLADPECPCNSDGENCARKHLKRIEDYGQETLVILARDPNSSSAEMNRLDEIIMQARGYRQAEERHICGQKVPEKEFVNLAWASNTRKYFEGLLVGTCDTARVKDPAAAALASGPELKISGSCKPGASCSFKVRAVETTSGTAGSIDDLARVIEDVERRAEQSAAPAASNRTFAQGTTNVTRYDFEFKIVDAAKLLVSHNPFTFAPTPGYPQELQPRLRERAATRLQVERIAANLDPDALLVDYHSIDRGAPIIGPDNVVESGNGRTMALIYASKEHPAVYQRYIAALKEIAPSYNLDPRQAEKLQTPVLVRLRTSKVNRRQFVEEANASTTIETSSIEKARSDAKLISAEMLTGLEVLDGENIEDALRAGRNRAFVQAFLGKLSQNEQARLVDAKGVLNQDGVRRLTMAIFVATFTGDVGLRLAERFFESTDAAVRNVFNGLARSLGPLAISEKMTATGQRDQLYTIGDDLARAVGVFSSIKKTAGMTVAKYLQQSQLFTRDLSPFQERILAVLDEYSRSARKIAQILGAYSQLVMGSSPPSQTSLIPDMGRPTKEQLFETAVRRTDGVLAGLARREASNPQQIGGLNVCLEARSAFEKYLDDAKAGHGAAEYWKGQAEAYSLLCGLGETGLLYDETPTFVEVFTNSIVKHYRAKAAFHKGSFRVVKPNRTTLVYLGCLKEDDWNGKTCSGNQALHKTIVFRTEKALDQLRKLEKQGVQVKYLGREGIAPRAEDPLMHEIEEALKYSLPLEDLHG
jgi:hypothetical protein